MIHGLFKVCYIQRPQCYTDVQYTTPLQTPSHAQAILFVRKMYNGKKNNRDVAPFSGEHSTNAKKAAPTRTGQQQQQQEEEEEHEYSHHLIKIASVDP